jgi:hypothetical protein
MLKFGDSAIGASMKVGNTSVRHKERMLGAVFDRFE